MLKKRFAGTAIALTLVAALMPALSEAAPRTRKPQARQAVTLDLFATLTRLWNLTLGTPEGNAWEKNGPGIDPQGKPLCTDCVIDPIGNGGVSEDPADAGV
jgi:hypothetical protein